MTAIATVNGVPLHAAGEALPVEELRQRACMELLRQAAARAGADVDAHLDATLRVPHPSEADCRRYFAANARRYATGARMQLRHILFAVTPGVDVALLRRRAEAHLVDLRTSGDFAQAARALSNCPSGAGGGDLGWVSAADCAPEFAQEVFAHTGLGVLPRLVHSRFGLHIVEIGAREPGSMPDYETARRAVAATLERRGFVTALRQYLRVLASGAAVVGVDLEGAATPLAGP